MTKTPADTAFAPSVASHKCESCYHELAGGDGPYQRALVAG